MDGGNDVERESMHEAGPTEGSVEGRRPGEGSGPSWRAWVLSIVAAIVLSVAATLIFGGSFRLPGASNAAAGKCGAAGGGPCCPAQTDAEKQAASAAGEGS